MKVLIINGSPRKEGNTTLAVREMEKVFAAENIEAYGLPEKEEHLWTNFI